jgi:hypothetical protein
MPKVKSNSKVVSNGHLKLRIPDDLDLGDYADFGLLVPESLNDKLALAPLDFTSISSKEVGQQHSLWAVRQSHILYLLGNLQAEIGNLKYDLKNQESRWRQRNASKYKLKRDADAALQSSEKLQGLRERLNKAQTRLERFQGLERAYAALRDAASREMTRRSTEGATKS